LRAPLAALRAAAGREVLLVDAPDSASVRAVPVAQGGLSDWVYALVAPFPTIQDSEAADDLRNAWAGAAAAPPLLVAPSTLEAMRSILGEPAAERVQVAEAASLVDQAWGQRPSLAIVPFEDLEPRWKVLGLGGLSPIHKSFDLSAYALVVHFGLVGEAADVSAIRGAVPWPASNRDPSRMTIVVMTGVTALTRATAWMMDADGLDYPAQDIGDWLREGDITHVSNEVAFAENCPTPDPNQASLRFCSPAKDIELLRNVGVKVVELTGNHVMDWGPQALLHTLDLYQEMGWQHFGGGVNLEDSLQPALFEHNGNRVAFLGCNPAGPPFDWATATAPGSAPCDLDRLFAEAAQLKSEGYVVIFTYQWFERYNPAPLPDQVAGFRKAIDVGAAIVSGSQAHQPQGFEFYAGGFIHYGLGNLFFDQMFSQDTRKEFIDRYVLYGGKHISTELLTAMLENWAQPRPMTEAERTDLLLHLFAVSGW
jgi:poly-gamma-glutamate synthesis protein (capsule biosynthesis protein)